MFRAIRRGVVGALLALTPLVWAADPATPTQPQATTAHTTTAPATKPRAAKAVTPKKPPKTATRKTKRLLKPASTAQ